MNLDRLGNLDRLDRPDSPGSTEQSTAGLLEDFLHDDRGVVHQAKKNCGEIFMQGL